MVTIAPVDTPALIGCGIAVALLAVALLQAAHGERRWRELALTAALVVLFVVLVVAWGPLGTVLPILLMARRVSGSHREFRGVDRVMVLASVLSIAPYLASLFPRQSPMLAAVCGAVLLALVVQTSRLVRLRRMDGVGSVSTGSRGAERSVP